MVKLIVLLKRRGDLAPEQFREYYESRHAPLAQSVIPSLNGYVRNYVRHDTFSAARQMGDTAPPAFDVITELHFEDQLAYERFRAAFSDPAVIARIASDEAHLFDPSLMQSFLVEEETSQLRRDSTTSHNLRDGSSA